jgi:hypothetical protein
MSIQNELEEKNRTIQFLKDKMVELSNYIKEQDELLEEQQNLKTVVNENNKEDILLYQIYINNKFDNVVNKISKINNDISEIREKYQR